MHSKDTRKNGLVPLKTVVSGAPGVQSFFGTTMMFG